VGVSAGRRWATATAPRRWRRALFAGPVSLALLLVAVPMAWADTSLSGSASYEPNDSIATAYGPLAGGVTYAGGLETQNDEDWFYLYTNGQQQFDISFTNLTDGCTNLIMSFVDANGEELHYVRPNVNETRHILYTSPGAARYYLRVYDLIGETCSYQLRVDPPTALTTQPPSALPPPTPSPESGSHATAPGRGSYAAACRRARLRISRVSSHLRAATSRRQRNLLRAKLRRARSEAGTYC
jgi:hypothetical protein